jgi:hypothetical protein
MDKRSVLMYIAVLLLAGCAASKQQPPAESSGTPDSSEPVTGSVVPPAPSSPTSLLPGASENLLVGAAQARGEGDFERAEGLLQRAQRIDARNPAVYLELSRLYLAQGNDDQARSMAERGLLYCSRDSCEALRALSQ